MEKGVKRKSEVMLGVFGVVQCFYSVFRLFICLVGWLL